MSSSMECNTVYHSQYSSIYAEMYWMIMLYNNIVLAIVNAQIFYVIFWMEIEKTKHIGMFNSFCSTM